MSKLCDVVNGCNFEDKDEIVKFLFLIHNTNKGIKDQLIKKMRMTDVLVDILQLAKMIKSTIQTVILSKQLILNVGKLGNTTTEVHSVTKHSQSHNRLNSSKPNHGRSQNHDKNWKRCGNCSCTHHPKQCPAYGKECFKCKKKNHFS